TDLTVGLLPTSNFSGGTMTTVDGPVHPPDPPTEEGGANPHPARGGGGVAAAKPPGGPGGGVRGPRRRPGGGAPGGREGGGESEAEENADAPRARTSVDEGATRLGEVALVDREGRIGKTGTVFFNTLLDENAASHIALGNGYAVGAGAEDADRINTSAIHIDF